MRSLHRICAFILTTLSFAVAPAALAASAELQEVRLWASPDSTRVVLDLSAPVSYAVFTLADPDRIVIDLEDVAAGATQLPAAATVGVVSGVRFAARENGGLRVVLDLTSKVEPKSFLTPPNETYGHRLVVDLGFQQALRPVKAATDSNNQRDVVVAIDAGHGGEDPGAVGKIRHAREDGRARDRAQARRPHQCGARHARGADARWRLLRAVPRTHPARA